jgi:hypothetical protein
MSPTQNPTLSLHLTPKCHPLGTITSLAAKLTIGGLPFTPDEPIFVFTNSADHDPSERHIRIEDTSGPLDCVLTRGDSVAVYAKGQVQEPVSIYLDTYPRDANTSAKDYIRHENGGIVGTGSFLPRPHAPGTYDISITCDAVPAVKLVTSLGSTATGTQDTLQQCIFMLGKVRQYPGEGPCATYWLSEPPASLDALKEYTSSMFPHIMSFFKDSGTYRLFLARGGTAGQTISSVQVLHRPLNAGPQALARAYNKFNVPMPPDLASAAHGTTFIGAGCSLIEYDPDTGDDSEWALTRVVHKSIVKPWVQLDDEDDGAPNDWFAEGMPSPETQVCRNMC